MYDYEYLIGVMITVVVMIVGMSLFTMTSELPSEHWCNEYNQTELSSTISIHSDYNYWCFKNETGWHFNKSKPMVLT